MEDRLQHPITGLTLGLIDVLDVLRFNGQEPGQFLTWGPEPSYHNIALTVLRLWHDVLMNKLARIVPQGSVNSVSGDLMPGGGERAVPGGINLLDNHAQDWPIHLDGRNTAGVPRVRIKSFGRGM